MTGADKIPLYLTVRSPLSLSLVTLSFSCPLLRVLLTSFESLRVRPFHLTALQICSMVQLLQPFVCPQQSAPQIHHSQPALDLPPQPYILCFPFSYECRNSAAIIFTVKLSRVMLLRLTPFGLDSAVLRGRSSLFVSPSGTFLRTSHFLRLLWLFSVVRQASLLWLVDLAKAVMRAVSNV